MSFKELGEYIAMCFEYLENPQKHLANAKKAPILKENYDVLIEGLESKLNRIDNLIYCKNKFESFGSFGVLNIVTADFDTLISYHQITEDDKKEIASKVHSKQQKISELLLLLLKILLSEIKIALIFLNSSESVDKILYSLINLSESNREIEKIIADCKIKDFRQLLSEKFQFSNTEYYNERINQWNNINESEINLHVDFRLFVVHCLKVLRINLEKKCFNLTRNKWSGLFYDLNYGIKLFSKLEVSYNLELKQRLHRVFRFEFYDRSLTNEVNIIEKISSIKDFVGQVSKLFPIQVNYLLELEKSISNLLDKKNTDTEFINKLFDEYKSKRNEFISSINTKLETLLKNIIPRISSEIEKAFQFEEIDSDLEYSRLVIENLKESRDRIFAGSRQKMIVKEIFWDLLPQGEWKTEGLIKTFKGYGWSKDEFDESRLTQIIKTLKPTICYIGKEKFQGYVVFGFDLSEKVVLECPKYGNAIYIIEDNWQEITKLSKWEARQLSQVTVIRHSDTWFERLKENLESKY